MSTTFKLDPVGNDALLHQLAAGFDKFGEEVASAIAERAPKNTGRYARTIKSTTFLENGIYRGEAIRGTGVQSKAQIWVIVYTTSKLGHLLELGTGGRWVPKDGPNAKLMVWDDKYGSGAAFRVHQPGMTRRPHFWPGLAAVLPRVGEIVGHGARSSRTNVNARVL